MQEKESNVSFYAVGVLAAKDDGPDGGELQMFIDGLTSMEVKLGSDSVRGLDAEVLTSKGANIACCCSCCCG